MKKPRKNIMTTTIKAGNFASAYQKALNKVLYFPDYEVSPRGLKIKELANLQLCIEDPRQTGFKSQRRSTQSMYVAAETLWYFSGSNDVNYINKFAKFWDTIKNPDNTANSAYGHLLFKTPNEHGLTQWQWAYQSLVNDQDSRQAIMHFNMPKHQYTGNKDFVCTLSATFQIRNNYLNFKVNMRSNDAILGTPTDVAFFCMLQQQMLNLLKPIYPDLELGTYVHSVDSFHLYEKHFELAKDMVKSRLTSYQLPSIEKNLIDKDGNASQEINDMYQSVMHNDPIYNKYNDELLDWMTTLINKNIGVQNYIQNYENTNV